MDLREAAPPSARTSQSPRAGQGGRTSGPRAAVPTPRARRAGAKPVPERDAAYSHLDLLSLRAYRKALTAEEGQVSYWRRIIQARLDVVRAGNLGSADGNALRPVLTDERVGAGRRALVEVLEVDDIPPLPNLSELWDRQVDPEDAAATAVLVEDLAEAEEQLSTYRRALHERIASATCELIARYREQPSLCLTALPQPPRAPAPAAETRGDAPA